MTFSDDEHQTYATIADKEDSGTLGLFSSTVDKCFKNNLIVFVSQINESSSEDSNDSNALNTNLALENEASTRPRTEIFRYIYQFTI